MLTDNQEIWLAHLSNTDVTKIYPYNEGSKNLFEKQKSELKSILGSEVRIVHRGASSLGISGKGELDIYIPVSLNDFDYYLKILTKYYGTPGSLYPGERARFNIKIDSVLAEIFLINDDSEGWKNGIKFESWLKKHPNDMKRYADLKESLNGESSREYYTRKLEFINDILEKAEN
jgi:GrpB-like predicted nucleotidyltransferase (UPF0157 family)